MFEGSVRDADVNERTGAIWRDLMAVTFASLGLLAADKKPYLNVQPSFSPGAGFAMGDT